MKKLWEDKYIKIAVLTIITLSISYLIINFINQSGSLFNGLFSIIGWIISVVSPLILGLVFAYILLPVVDFFDGFLKKAPIINKKPGLCRGLSIFITIFTFFLLIFILLSLVISTITSNIHFISLDDLNMMTDYIRTQAVNLYNEIRTSLMRFEIVIPTVDSLIDTAKRQITSIDGKKGTDLAAVFGSGLLSAVNLVKNIVVQFSFAVIFSVYFLYDNKGLSAYWNRVFKALLGDKAYNILQICLSDLDACFTGYIRGQLADALIMAVIVTIAFSIVGVPYAALIGIATGIGNLIPYLGPIVAYGMTVICCLIKSEFKLIVIGIIIVFIIQTIDGNILNPKLLSNSINVNPVLVIVALLFGSAIGGLLGMLLAVPVAAFLNIQFVRFVEYKEKKKELKP